MVTLPTKQFYPGVIFIYWRVKKVLGHNPHKYHGLLYIKEAIQLICDLVLFFIQSTISMLEFLILYCNLHN